MNSSSTQVLNQPDSVLKQQLRTELESGIALSADPVNAGLPELAIRVTTVNSPWFARTCRICGDKFREGDQVRLCPRCGESYHDDNQYNLYCWQKKFADGGVCKAGNADDRFSEQLEQCDFTWSQPLPDEAAAAGSADEAHLPHAAPPAQLVNQFVGGVEAVWRPFGEQQSYKVLPGSPEAGRKCPWCRFSIRAGDWVVACPCESDCGTYFHQDVFRHLTCWNEWNGIEGNNYCPNTGAPYPQPPGGSEGTADAD